MKWAIMCMWFISVFFFFFYREFPIWLFVDDFIQFHLNIHQFCFDVEIKNRNQVNKKRRRKIERKKNQFGLNFVLGQINIFVLNSLLYVVALCIKVWIIFFSFSLQLTCGKNLKFLLFLFLSFFVGPKWKNILSFVVTWIN